uniref:NACHT LRR and PYD domain-containing protein n=1 Tax=Sinocyclocheilus anshuiensis TaxID=1608454 RepID=A0A671T281_9TELE
IFVHLSIQEFFAALFRFLSFVSNKKHKSEITDFQKKEVDKALQSENGHMDLYLQFLLGLSLQSNQSLLPSLLTQTRNTTHSSLEIIEYIKEKIRENPSPEKSINLFHCLNELNDHFLQHEVQTYLKGTRVDRLADAKLSPDQWSALVFVLLNSDEELTDFELSKYHQSEEAFTLLNYLMYLNKTLEIINIESRIFHVSMFNLHYSFAALASALRSNPSLLRELNLSSNKPGDSGVKLLSHDPQCNLEKLQMGKYLAEIQLFENLESKGAKKSKY